ncbi:acyltransferase family protein [Spirosoma pulveris]
MESRSTIGMTFNILHEYGKYGVQIFFVVSGFVIPLSLKKSNYDERGYPRFLWKRVLRLHPPY